MTREQLLKKADELLKRADYRLTSAPSWESRKEAGYFIELAQAYIARAALTPKESVPWTFDRYEDDDKEEGGEEPPTHVKVDGFGHSVPWETRSEGPWVAYCGADLGRHVIGVPNRCPKCLDLAPNGMWVR